jgi:hypothetical protein
MSLPVYSRAGHSRTVTLVVAPSLMAVSTGAGAREFRAAGTKGAGALDRGNVATIGNEIPGSFDPRGFAGPASCDSGTRPIGSSIRFEAAMVGIHAQAQRDPAAARLIERTRKVE